MTDKKVDFSSFFNWAETKDTYWSELAIIQFTEEIVRYMAKCKISRVEIANRLDVSPAYVTKLLKGDNNFTIETMVKVAQVLDSELQLHLVPKGSITKWFDIIESDSDNKSEKPQPININDCHIPAKSNPDYLMEVNCNETLSFAG